MEASPESAKEHTAVACPYKFVKIGLEKSKEKSQLKQPKNRPISSSNKSFPPSLQKKNHFPPQANTDPSPISICNLRKTPISICAPKLIVYICAPNVLGENNITSSTCRPD